MGTSWGLSKGLFLFEGLLGKMVQVTFDSRADLRCYTSSSRRQETWFKLGESRHLDPVLRSLFMFSGEGALFSAVQADGFKYFLSRSLAEGTTKIEKKGCIGEFHILQYGPQDQTEGETIL